VCVIGLMLLAGCDLRQHPLASGPADSLAPRHGLVDPVDADAFSTSGALPVPPDNMGWGTVPLRPLGIVFPEAMWVRIRTSGTVEYTINPAAEGKPCQNPCVDHVAPMGRGGSVGGAGIPGTGYLRVSVTTGPPGIANQWRPIPFGDGQLESIVRVDAGWELQASRMGIQGILSCLFCNPSIPSTPWYLLDGGTVITAQKVIPLQVAARTPVVARGKAVEFDAVAIEHVSDFQWMYIATDGAEQLEAVVHACAGQTFCSYAPRDNGYMVVTGRYPNGTTFEARTDPVRVVDAQLTLECTPAEVMRAAKDVTCTAAAEGASDFEVTGWQFTSADGRHTITPSDPAQDSRKTWAGLMVTSGTVTVQARVAGQPASASAQVTVINRQWGTRAPHTTFEPEGSSGHRIQLPRQIIDAEDLGAANWFSAESDTDNAPDYTTSVDVGPNEGMIYFGEETTLRVFGYYRINIEAMSQGSRFYNAQQRVASGGNVIGGLSWCPPHVVTGDSRQAVTAHERKHGTEYEIAFTRDFGPVISRMEQLVALDGRILDREYGAAWNQLDLVARTYSEGMHKRPGGKVVPMYAARPCALKNERGNLLQNTP
jgi:hypothetical protein